MKKRRKLFQTLFALAMAFFIAVGSFFGRVVSVPAAAVEGPLGLALSIGEIVWNLYSSAGLTICEPSIVNDSIFDMSLQSCIDKGLLRPVDGVDMSGWEWDDVLNEVERMANDGESNFTKNNIIPVFEKMSPSSGGSGGGGWKDKLKQWLAAIGISASIQASMVGGIQPVTDALTQWSQPYAEYGMPVSLSSSPAFDVLISALSSQPDLVLGYYTDAYSDGLYRHTSFRLLNNRFSYAVFSPVRHHLAFIRISPTNSYFYYHCFKQPGAEPEVIKYSKISDGPNYVNQGWDFDVTDRYGRHYENVYVYDIPYFDNQSDAYSYLNSLQSSNISIYSPDLVGKDGNLQKDQTLKPNIDPNKNWQPATQEQINNYITNQGDTINQGDVVNNYNTFIEEHTHINETPVAPEMTPAPGGEPNVTPSVSPELTPPVTPALTPLPEDDMKKYAVDLTKVFPFCIPFDLVHLFNVLNAEPVAPSFEIPIDLEFSDPFTGRKMIDYHEKFELNMEDYDSAVKIFRAFQIIMFIIGLILITRNLIRG